MIHKRNQPIGTLELWERYAGPKSAIQWQDGRSAKECAKAWLGTGDSGSIPAEILQVFRSHDDFGELQSWTAEPECQVPIDAYSGPANIDVLINADDGRGPIAIEVEAKADEPFGRLLGEEYCASLERRLKSAGSNGVNCLVELSTSVLPPVTGRVPGTQLLRYQLLTATAAALSHARAMDASRAVVIVHEFRTNRTDPDI